MLLKFKIEGLKIEGRKNNINFDGMDIEIECSADELACELHELREILCFFKEEAERERRFQMEMEHMRMKNNMGK